MSTDEHEHDDDAMMYVRAASPFLNGNGPWIPFQFANQPRILTSTWESIFDSRLVWKSILKFQVT